ncbi:hypothetical protein NL108_009302 [Boleophthalmus pectinirostris]|nr:hypothetical protein NL108_009302 [Boleophthalmus pectinirostris]
MTLYTFLISSAFRQVFSFHEVYMEYYFINVEMNWYGAQQHCREYYTDLATISSIEDLRRLKVPNTYTKGYTWIGLADDPASLKGFMRNNSNSWRWSVTGTTNPGGYQKWGPSEPNNGGAHSYCVYSTYGLWADASCEDSLQFVCFTGSSKGSKNYTFINTQMTWENAQNYCRQRYTDLAMIEKETENSAVVSIISNNTVWIGLYRVPFRWSDGSTSTFTNWAISQPDNFDNTQHCVKVDRSLQWYDAFCADVKFAFHCEKRG